MYYCGFVVVCFVWLCIVEYFYVDVVWFDFVGNVDCVSGVNLL